MIKLSGHEATMLFYSAVWWDAPWVAKELANCSLDTQKIAQAIIDIRTGNTPAQEYRGVAEGIIKAVDNYQTSYERNRRKMK